MSDSELRYAFTCSGCSKDFSILLERIPPVQARFRCPHCQDPMDFPSREEARVYVRLHGGAAPHPAPARVAQSPVVPFAAEVPAPTVPETPLSEDGEAERRFGIEKSGFENEVYDHRDIRNLIRAGELSENDRIRLDGGDPTLAGELEELKPLFLLKKKSRFSPPRCCRTHTARVAHFLCSDTDRPLCEECAPEKKFGYKALRLCKHCGGTAAEIIAAS